MKNLREKTGGSKAALRVIEGGRASVPQGVTGDATDLANAEKLQALYGQNLRFVPAFKHWLWWTGRNWREDKSGTRVQQWAAETSRVLLREAFSKLRAARKGQDKAAIKIAEAEVQWARNSQSRARIEAMIALARSSASIVVEHEKLDAQPWLLNVQNGTIDLQTGMLRRHERRDYLTKVAPVAYNSRATAPQWVRFLKDVLPDADVLDFLQRFVGYSSTGDTGERVLAVLHGGGRNGKSVFLRLIQAALGPYASTTLPALLLSKGTDAHPTEVADLFGVRLAISSEVRKGRSFDEEQVKRLTGNDTLKARRMREDPWEFPPTHKLIIAANHRPHVSDTSESFWDRVRLVPFAVRIADGKVDPRLVQKLMKELPGILVWILEGLRRYRKDGLRVPKAIQAATAEYRNVEDRAGAFLRDCCERAPRVFTYSEQIRKAYEAWAEPQNLEREVTDNQRAAALREWGCKPRRLNSGAGWVGIRLKGLIKSRPREGAGQ